MPGDVPAHPVWTLPTKLLEVPDDSFQVHQLPSGDVVIDDGEVVEIPAEHLDLLIVVLQQARANVVANPTPTHTAPQREF